LCSHLVIFTIPNKNLNNICIFFTILSDNSKLNGSGLTLNIKVQTVNMLVSLMVKIQKHTWILFYGGTILKQSFVKISELLKKLPTDTRRKTSVKQWTTLPPYYYQKEAVYSWKNRVTSAWKMLFYFHFMIILPVPSNLWWLTSNSQYK
jgi:hypothetical protein